MITILNILVPILLFAVVCVLIMGILTMKKGTNTNLSQKLMRWRVGLQFLTVLAIVLILYLRSQNG